MKTIILAVNNVMSHAHNASDLAQTTVQHVTKAIINQYNTPL